MNRTLKVAGAALSLALATVAGAAQAVTYTVTITGTVRAGYDTIDAFGFGSDPLAGRAISAVFKVDTSKGTFESYPGDNRVFGFGLDKPVMSTFQIAGSSLFEVLSGSGAGGVIRGDNGVGGALYGLLDYDDDVGQPLLFYHSFDMYTQNGAFGGVDVGPPSDISLGPDVYADGGFQIDQVVPTAKDGLQRRTFAVVRYTPETFTVTSGSVVPEPQIWAMLVIGFGVTGVALQQGRRARAKTALAT